MIADIESRFEQLSPLIDDLMQHIACLSRDQTEHAVLSNLAQNQIGVATALFSIRSETVPPAITPEKSQSIIELLSRKSNETAEMLKTAIEKIMVGARVQ